LYDGLQANRLLGLLSEGWDVRPNFHLAFRADNLHPYPHVRMSLRDYLVFWKQNPKMIRQYPIVRETQSKLFFGNSIGDWKHEGLVSIEDVGEVERVTLNSRRKTINVCPGLNLFYRWPLARALQLDEERRFVGDARAKLQQAFSCWGQDVAAGGTAEYG
jgi:hypothetical protein